MKKYQLLSLLSIFLVCSCQGSGSNLSSSESTSNISSLSTSQEIEPTTYQNPVWEPVLADPAIIRGPDGVFYAYGTQDNAEWGDYFGYRYIPILTSTNLVDWEYANQVFKIQTMPTWGTLGAGLWAPDIVKIGDKYLLYYSLSVWGDANPGIGVASSDHPLGPWTDHGKMFDSNSIGVVNSIDPAVYVDENLRVYMIWGSFVGIYGLELTSDGLQLLDGDNAKNTKVLLAGIDNGRWNVANYEGAYISKVGSYYYMYLSTGGCCDGHNSTYRVVVCRSEEILGPYVDKNENLMANTSGKGTLVVDGNDKFVGVGHNSIIVDDADDYWIVYHGYDLSKPGWYGSTNRRSLLIDKLLWTEDGWPYVLGYGASVQANRPFINK